MASNEREWYKRVYPVIRHEGGAPSNNLIKDAPYSKWSFRWAH